MSSWAIVLRSASTVVSGRMGCGAWRLCRRRGQLVTPRTEIPEQAVESVDTAPSLVGEQAAV
jgi:hypothetical protein